VTSAGPDVVTHAGMGLTTCYDLRFSELFQALVDRAAESLPVPAACPDKRIGHWRLQAQARAVENQRSTRGARCWSRPATGRR